MSNETHRPGLNISYHLSEGLKLYSYHESALSNRNLAYLCEGETLAIQFNCNSCIPLYAATVITGSQLKAAVHGGHPQVAPGMFKPKPQQVT